MSAKAKITDEEAPVVATIPGDLVKLLRRLIATSDGRIQVIITKEDGRLTDWTVTELGKVEVPAS